MATIIDALLVTLGIDNKDFVDKLKMSKLELKQYEEQIKQQAADVKEMQTRTGSLYDMLREKALGFFAVITGMGVQSFTNQQAEADRETGKLASSLGIAVEEVGAWQGAVIMADGTAAEFQGSIRALAGSLVDIEKNLPRAERSLKVLQAAGIQGLGIGKKSDVLDVLDQLADRMSKMSSFEARRLGERMGLDSGTIRLLRQGKESISAVKAEMLSLGVATQAGVDAAEALEDAQKKLTMSNTQVGRVMMQMIVPAMTWLSEKMLIISKWAAQHGTLVKSVFIGLAVAIGIAGAAAFMAAPPILAISWPVLLIATAVGLLAAGIGWLVMKFKEWQAQGSETTTRWGKFFAMILAGWNKIKESVFLVLGSIWDLIKTYVAIWGDAFGLLFSLLTGDTKGVKDAWESLCKNIDKYFTLAMKLVVYAAGLAAGALTAMWFRMWDGLKNKAADVLGWLDGKFKSMGLLGKIMEFASPVGLAAQAGARYGDRIRSVNATDAMNPTMQRWAAIGSTTATSETSIQKIDVILPNATDAQGIARDLPGAMKYTNLVPAFDLGMR